MSRKAIMTMHSTGLQISSCLVVSQIGVSKCNAQTVRDGTGASTPVIQAFWLAQRMQRRQTVTYPDLTTCPGCMPLKFCKSSCFASSLCCHARPDRQPPLVVC